MSTKQRFGFVLAALIALFALTPAVQADPLTFSNVRAAQPSPTTAHTNVTTNLFANPGAVLTNGTRVTFFIDINGTLPTGVTNILRVTFVQAGSPTVVQNHLIPFAGTIPPPYTQGVDQEFPVLYQAEPISMTVEIIGSPRAFTIPGGVNAGQVVDSYTYTFNVVQPVPEPATMILFGTGLAGIIAGVRKRRARSS